MTTKSVSIRKLQTGFRITDHDCGVINAQEEFVRCLMPLRSTFPRRKPEDL